MKRLYTVIAVREGDLEPRKFYLELLPFEDLITEMDFRFGILEDEIYFVFDGHVRSLDPNTLK